MPITRYLARATRLQKKKSEENKRKLIEKYRRISTESQTTQSNSKKQTSKPIILITIPESDSESSEDNSNTSLQTQSRAIHLPEYDPDLDTNSENSQKSENSSNNEEESQNSENSQNNENSQNENDSEDDQNLENLIEQENTEQDNSIEEIPNNTQVAENGRELQISFFADFNRVTPFAIYRQTPRVDFTSIRNRDRVNTTPFIPNSNLILTESIISELAAQPTPNNPVVIYNRRIEREFNFRNSSTNSRNMANEGEENEGGLMSLKEICKEIPQYSGEEDGLNDFLLTIDDLWALIDKEGDRRKFLIVVRARLKKDAKRAVANGNFEQWEEMRLAICNSLRTENYTDRLRAELGIMKQESGETVTKFAKKVEDHLKKLNDSLGDQLTWDAGRQNDKLARQTFSNGLKADDLKKVAFYGEKSTLKDTISFILEKERSLPSFGTNNSAKCTFCQIAGHEENNCRNKNRAIAEYKNKSQNANQNKTPYNTGRTNNQNFGNQGNFNRNQNYGNYNQNNRNQGYYGQNNRNQNYWNQGNYNQNNRNQNYGNQGYNGQNYGYGNPNGGNQNQNKAIKQEITCYNCNQTGHTSRECSMPRQNLNQSGNQNRNQNNRANYVGEYEEPITIAQVHSENE